jgi:thioredoxin reductase
VDAKFDVLIVGSGPAGLSAGLVLGRCRRLVLVGDSGAYRSAKSRALHCFLGHDGVQPANLLESSRRQLERYDCVTLSKGKVEEVSGSANHFIARVAANRWKRER